MSPKSYALGPLEMEVVGQFKEEEPLSVGELQERLKRSGKPLAYTTVMTVLVRLHAKGMVQRRKEGRQYLYTTGKGRAQLGQTVLTKLKNSLFRHDRLKPILALLDSDDDMTSQELMELRKAVDEMLKSKGKKR